MNRRRFLAASLMGSAACARPQGRRPNVLFLVVDDMNDYGFYSTLGGVKTPYLDR